MSGFRLQKERHGDQTRSYVTIERNSGGPLRTPLLILLLRLLRIL
jgi:hypothetical protein